MKRKLIYLFIAFAAAILPAHAQKFLNDELTLSNVSLWQQGNSLYVKEGKSQLTIAVGCTGGKHRSITFARKIAEYCEKLGYKPGIQHRDSVR